MRGVKQTPAERLLWGVRRGRVRLRIINGATATGFFISTPGLATRLVAVDGSACRPLSATSYPLA